jgi:hypothetical protein
MSQRRRLRREQERLSQKHFSVFGDILMGFYEFLESTPKPSDEAVRQEFIDRQNAWTKYCATHQLTETAKLMFNQEVGQSWRTRYTKKETE